MINGICRLIFAKHARFELQKLRTDHIPRSCFAHGLAEFVFLRKTDFQRVNTTCNVQWYAKQTKTIF